MDADLVGFLVLQYAVWRHVLRDSARRRLARRLAYIEERRLARAPVDEGELAMDDD